VTLGTLTKKLPVCLKSFNAKPKATATALVGSVGSGQAVAFGFALNEEIIMIQGDPRIMRDSPQNGSYTPQETRHG
jgi:hypothetical protein